MCLAVARRWEVHCPLFIDTTAIQLSETAARDSHHSRCPGDPKRPSRAGSDQVRDNEDGQYKPILDHLRLEGKSHPHACHHQTHEPAGANGRDQRVGGQNQKKDEERCPP